MDIHICGGCLTKFTDIYKFISHKLSCNLSSTSSLKQTASLIKEAKVISQQIHANKTAPQTTSNNEISQPIKVICAESNTQQFVEEPKQSSGKENGHSIVLMPQCQTRNTLEVMTSGLSQAIKQNIEFDSRSNHKFFTVAGSTITETNPSPHSEKNEQNVLSQASPRRNIDLSTDDIAVYVVSPKSFASSVKGQCDFSPQTDFQDNSLGRIVWTDSCSMSHFGGEISNGYTVGSAIAASVHKKLENSMNSTFTNIDAVMQGQLCNGNGPLNIHIPTTSLKSKFSSNHDTVSSSDSSTPCPEDLEVGQISAAMLGQDRNQQGSLRTKTDASFNGSKISLAEESVCNIAQNSYKSENQSNVYVRDKAASAPIIKNEVQNKRRVSIEKRERLQGVSDDLLACSPYLETLQNANVVSNRKALKKTAQPISTNLSQQMCYKAIFTSPSSAGHRLAPTQTEQPTYTGNPSCQENPNTVPHQLLSRTQKSSKAILYKNISASARRISKLADKPQHGVASPKKKTERKIAFDKIQVDALSTESLDVNSHSQGDVKTCKELFETLTVHKHETPELSSLTSENGPAKVLNDDRTYKSLPQFELTDLNTLSSAVQKQEEISFQNINIKNYEHKSTGEPQMFHIVGLNTANSKSEFSIMTQGSDTIELFSPMSAALDENAVIMVYKTMDSNIHQMISKNVQSSQADNQSLQSVGMYQACNFLDLPNSHGQNLITNQPVFHQQGADSDLYINIVPGDNPDCGMPQLLFQNFVCSDPNLSQLISISTGNSALENSPGVFTVSQGGHGAAEGSPEVVVQKLLQKQPELHVEKEKCIMRSKKAAMSTSTMSTSAMSISTGHAVDKSVSEARGACGGSQKGKSLTPPASTANEALTSNAYKDDGHNGKKSKYFTCKFDKCRYTTIFYKDFQRHYRTHTGERPYQCKDCGKTFNRSDKLKIHSRWHAGSKPFKCHQCDYAALEGGSLKKHMRIHTDERPFKCQICSYASRNSSQLIVHLRTHTGDAPFHCTTCTAKFKINSDLKRHMRVHTGEKPFKCDRCDYKSSNKGNLKTHVKINHSQENEIPCPKCEFVTSSKKRLREHAKLHDSKPLERCSQCEYTCTSRNALRIHTSIHNDDKPYHCSYCSYSSKQGGNLKKHVENLHLDRLRLSRHSKTRSETSNPASGGKIKGNIDRCEDRKPRGKSCSYRKLFECSDCGSSFVRADSLRCHMKQHSPDAGQNTCKETAKLQPQEPQATKEFQSGHPSNATDVSSSSGYGCQGIQQIVAAASRIYEDNLFSDNFTGDVADVSKHLCNSSSLFNQPSLSKPYDISGLCSDIVVSGHPLPVCRPKDGDAKLLDSKIKPSLIHQEPGDDVNSSPAQLQSTSEGNKRSHLPWEHQSYTVSLMSDEANISPSSFSSHKSGNSAGLNEAELKCSSLHNYQAKPKQATGVSQNNKRVGSQTSGLKFQRRKRSDTLSRPPTSSASFVVSPISAPSLQPRQDYYPDVILQQMTPGVSQVMDEFETAMVVTQRVIDGPGMEPTYNIQLVPAVQQGSSQMSAITQFSIQPGPNLQYQSAATHIQIVLPADTVLEAHQPCGQVGSQVFTEALNFTESQLLDPTSQPVISSSRTKVASPLTASL